MNNKYRESQSASHQGKQREVAEERVISAFYAELQQAVNEVDWQKVMLPELRDRKRP